MASMTMLAAITQLLLGEDGRDEGVVLLGEDIGVFGPPTSSLEQRVFDTPISESTIVGASVGLSVAGLVPVVEIQFGGFTMQAYHQLVGQLARFRYRSRSRYHCPVTVRQRGEVLRTPEADDRGTMPRCAPGLRRCRQARPTLGIGDHDDPVVVFESCLSSSSKCPTAFRTAGRPAWRARPTAR